jgi:hypothetical protein
VLYPGFLSETNKGVQTKITTSCTSHGWGPMFPEKLEGEQWKGNESTAPGSGKHLWNLHVLEGKESALVQRASKTIFLKLNRSQEINGVGKFLWYKQALTRNSKQLFSFHTSHPVHTDIPQHVHSSEEPQWFWKVGIAALQCGCSENFHICWPCAITPNPLPRLCSMRSHPSSSLWKDIISYSCSCT